MGPARLNAMLPGADRTVKDGRPREAVVSGQLVAITRQVRPSSPVPSLSVALPS